MFEIIVSAEFQKLYIELPVSIKKKAEKQEKLFRNNPFHPSLHTEKLEPKGKQLWSFRIDKSYRIIFRFLDGKTVLFLTVGPHGWIYRLKNRLH
jgi:toxin HigB-1